MLLDALRDFEWLNEPLDVNFEEAGMRVLTHNKTDRQEAFSSRAGKHEEHMASFLPMIAIYESVKFLS